MITNENIILARRDSKGNYYIQAIYKNSQAFLTWIRDNLKYEMHSRFGRDSFTNNLFLDYKILVLENNFNEDDIIRVDNLDVRFIDNDKVIRINKWLRDNDLELWIQCVTKAANDIIEGDKKEKEQIEKEIEGLKNKMTAYDSMRWTPAKDWYEHIMSSLEKKEYDKVYI